MSCHNAHYWRTVQTCQTRSVCKPRPPAYIRDPACIQGLASISTTTLDPRPVFKAWLVFKARLLFEKIRYVLGGDAHCRNLANAIEPSMCGGGAACCQITLTTCCYYYHDLMANAGTGSSDQSLLCCTGNERLTLMKKPRRLQRKGGKKRSSSLRQNRNCEILVAGDNVWATCLQDRGKTADNCGHSVRRWTFFAIRNYTASFAYARKLTVCQLNILHWTKRTDKVIGSRPSDHYFRSVWFVWLFVCAEFLSAVLDPISIKLGHKLYVWV